MLRCLLKSRTDCKDCGVEYVGETAKTELDERRKDVDNVKNEKYTRSEGNVYCLTSINPPLQTMQQLKITSQTRRKGKLWIKNQTEESDR